MTPFSLYKQNRSFFLAYGIWMGFALYILLGFSKVGGHLLLNPLHSVLLDYIFRAFTFLGDGFFILGLAVLLFFLKKRYISLLIIAAYVISGMQVQLIKLFYESPRPALFLKNIDYTHFVEGVTLHNYNSFPSGHTTSAFALAAILAFSGKNKVASVIWLIIAALVGYSRIYLSQHFLEDVLAGSVIGILSGSIAWLFLRDRLKELSALKMKGKSS